MIGNYTIKIKVIDNDTEWVIGKRETGSIEIAEQILGDVEKWIEDWEAIHYTKCCQCGITKKREELSEPDNPDWEDKLVCQDCLEELMKGKKKLKEI